MPRGARKTSSSGWYHVVSRGNGKQIIFEDDSDRRFYLNTLQRCSSEEGVSIIAWCLMDNHVHLLVDDPHQHLSHLMARVNGIYAHRYNDLADHKGHVFQDRFRSFPIDTESYLLELVRYVHNNPEKAGICATEEYQWSSFSEYVGVPTICRTETVLEMLGGPDSFRRFCKEGISPSVWLANEISPQPEVLQRIACAALDPIHPRAVSALPRKDRNRCLRTLRETGFTIRQIERLTGIGKSTVSDATRITRQEVEGAIDD